MGIDRRDDGFSAGAEIRWLRKYRNSHKSQSERKQVFGSGCGIDTAATQASAPLLWGAGAELAVARAGDGAGWPEAGGREQGTPAKESARRLRRSAGRTPGAIFVGAVAGAHLRGGSAQVQRVWRAGAFGWVHHRAGDGSADTGTCR